MVKNQKQTKKVGKETLYYVPDSKMSPRQRENNKGNYIRKKFLTAEQKKYHGV